MGFFDWFKKEVEKPDVRAKGKPDEKPTVKAVREWIRKGTCPDNVTVRGSIDLKCSEKLTRLPNGLTVDGLDLSQCVALKELPSDLKVRRLNLTSCKSLAGLPAGFECYELVWEGSQFRSFPDSVRVKFKLDLRDSVALEELPVGLKVNSLILQNCISLVTLPENLEVSFLDLAGCRSFSTWPKNANVEFGNVRLRDCTQIRSLPEWLTNVNQLDLSGCTGITSLPEGIRINSWVDIFGTRITKLPESLAGVGIRWRGAQIDERIAFHPESITIDEVLSENNVELRRAKLDRMGYERFFAEAKAEVIDADFDAGGQRRLLRVPMTRDEPLVCVAVLCPSTGNQYIIRVPPTMKRCRQAVAWIAGFDNPNDYKPRAET